MNHKLPTVVCIFTCLSFIDCSETSQSCQYDTDCPNMQICLNGICSEKPTDPCLGVSCPWGQVCQNGICVGTEPPVDGGQDAADDGGAGGDEASDPCAGVNCPAGKVCQNGICVNQDEDKDGDGWVARLDCDDNNPAINPASPEICNQKDDNCNQLIDEGGVCSDCDPAAQSPIDNPPFPCNETTPCDQCVNYLGRNYFCRSAAGGPYGFVAVPDSLPCDAQNQCKLVVCAGTTFHCDAAEGMYVPGGIPTMEQELCNGLDDNCNGSTDEGDAALLCPQWEHATASCVMGECSYTCTPGFHDCGSGCLDDTSPASCAARCEPCPDPLNGNATCVNGTCGIVCDQGFSPVGNECLSCATDTACGPTCTPCPQGQSCCSGVCTPTDTAQNCGHCGWACGTPNDKCCFGRTCCPVGRQLCCGNYCCADNGSCCPGNFCAEQGGRCCDTYACNPPWSGECCNGMCCGDGNTCYNNSFCCDAAHPVCCSSGCCGVGQFCCGDNGCCPNGYRCCPNGGCCPPGSSCGPGNTCN